MRETKLSISVENLAPTNGGSLAPLWFGFHNGQFQAFQVGQKSSAAFERLAEDGDTSGVTSAFTAANKGTIQGTLIGGLGGPFAPNERVQTSVAIDPKNAGSRYFSYAAMILPSNDQFVANADSRDVEIFSSGGRFLGAEFVVNIADAWEAGTEVNDEIAANTPFLAPVNPNAGTAEDGVVTRATGYKPKGAGGVLDTPRFSNANFLAPGYRFAKIRVANLVEGGSGDDFLLGTEAIDDIFAGDGNNTVFSRGGNDRVTSGSGRDRIYTAAGNDFISSGGGDDTISSGSGNDTIDAGDGNDHITAGNGNDIIFAGNGNDWIVSGNGDNIINAGLGQDRVYAGRNIDTFVLNAGDGEVRIIGYQSRDRFSLGSGLTQESITISRQGQNTLLSSGSDVLAILQGVRTSEVGFV